MKKEETLKWLEGWEVSLLDDIELMKSEYDNSIYSCEELDLSTIENSLMHIRSLITLVKETIDSDTKNDIDLSKINLSDLDLSVRLSNIFRRCRIINLEQLSKKTELDLRRIRGFGLGCLEEVKNIFKEYGLTLKEF